MKVSALKVQAPPEGYIASNHMSAGAAGDMAAPHGSFTMQLADGQHQQHDRFEQTASMAYNEETSSLTSEQLAAAYAANQAGFDPQAGFGSSTLSHHQLHPGEGPKAVLKSLLAQQKFLSTPGLPRYPCCGNKPSQACGSFCAAGHIGQDQLSMESFGTAGAAAMQPGEHATLYAQHEPLQYSNTHDQAQQEQEPEDQHKPVYHQPAQPAESEAHEGMRPQSQELGT